MSFEQFKMDQVDSQSRGIFNYYIYESGDLLDEVETVGYFEKSRFADDPAWPGSTILCRLGDGVQSLIVESDGISAKRAKKLNEVFSGGANGGPRLFPYAPEAENLITATISPDGDPTIPSPQIIGAEDYTKFQLQASRPSYIQPFAGFFRAELPSNAVPQTVRSFHYTGQEIELYFRYIQGSCLVFIDGELSSKVDLNSGVNQPRYFKLDTGSAKRRRYDLVCSNELWGGLALEANTTIYPTRDSSPSIAILGDSFTGGTGSTIGQSFVHHVRWKMDAYDTNGFGVGGSGYINNTGDGKFISRLQEVVDANHDYLLVAGGINDTQFTKEEFQKEVDLFYNEALKSWPTDRIIIVSNWVSTSIPEGSQEAIFRDILKAKANEIGCRFINATESDGGSWIFGTGYVTNEQGDGNADIMISGDAVHPTDDGHLLLGHLIAKRLLTNNEGSK